MKQSFIVLTFLRQLLAAHTPADVAKTKSQFQHLRQDQHICEVQKAQELVPDACYRVLSLQQAWGLIDRDQFEQMEQVWDRQCETAAKKALYASDESLQVHLGDLSSTCQSAVRHSLEIHRYRWSGN